MLKTNVSTKLIKGEEMKKTRYYYPKEISIKKNNLVTELETREAIYKIRIPLKELLKALTEDIENKIK